MRFKSTWILAVLLLIIAAYYFLVEERRKEEAEREARVSRRLLPYDKERVDRFTLINPQGDSIEVVRSEPGWGIVHPVDTDASKATIEAILMQLLPGQKLDSFEDIGNLSDYGLDPPYATIIFRSRDRTAPDTIFVGDKTPTSPSCYIRIGSSDTVLVSREMTHNIVNKNLYHLRDKNFLHLPSEAIDSLYIEGDGRVFALSRADDTWWTGNPPVRANRPLVESYLKTLTLAIVYGFPSEDLSALDRYGLEDPERRIVISSGGREIETRFGDLFEDRVYAFRSGLDKVLLLEQKVLEPFEWTDRDVVSRKLSFFDPRGVARILLETPGTRIVIEKREEGWFLGAAPVTQAKVQTFLRMLGRIEFETIENRGQGDPFDTSLPYSMRVSLEAEGGFTVEKIAFFRSEEGEEKASSLSSSAAGSIGPGTIAELERLVETD